MDIEQALAVVNELIDKFIAAPPPGTSLSNYPTIVTAKSAVNQFVSEQLAKDAAGPATVPPAGNGDQRAPANGDQPLEPTTAAT